MNERDLAALLVEASLYLDPNQQGTQWPDPIAWDGRPLLDQARDMAALLGDRVKGAFGEDDECRRLLDLLSRFFDSGSVGLKDGVMG